MSSQSAITTIDAESIGLKKIASGKVREIFEVDSTTLLFVATDRISAYDIILQNVSPQPPKRQPTNPYLTTQPPQGIPSKGALLTQLSTHWFDLIHQKIPTLQTHLISTTTLPPSIPPPAIPHLTHRTMHVRRVPVVPLESIVRGYITGSAWAEYRRSGTVHGMPMPAGLRESQKLPAPIWTPSTKAEQGAHDENISRERAVAIVGEDVAGRIEEASLRIYELVCWWWGFLWLWSGG
jgi:phosphoribosylaminoimidazole-succinocarboxamide synthase